MSDGTCSVVLPDGSKCDRPLYPRGGSMCTMHRGRYYKHGDPLGGGRPPGECRAFFEAAMLLDTDECIIWPYSLRNGYGQLKDSATGRITYVTVLACERFYGPRPIGQRYEAAHGPCHNPACFNPRHLRWATCKENNADKHRDGTARRGRGQLFAKDSKAATSP